MFKRVLVALDGSPLAEHALGHARRFSRLLGAPIELVTCLSVGASPLRDELQRLADGYLQGVCGTLRADGFDASTRLVSGDAAAAIAEEADREPGTLLAMCTHGRGGAMRWAVGTVTDRVLRSARCATLIARPADAPPTAEPALGALIVALDGSALAEQSLEITARLARSSRATVHLLRIVPADAEVHLAHPGFAGAWRDEAEYDAARCEEYLQQIAARLRGQGLSDVFCALRHGAPADGIVACAQQTPDSLVVMTSHGRSGIGRWLLGSVAERVARNSPRPVLLLRAGT